MRLSIGLFGLLLIALVAESKDERMETKTREAYAACAKELGIDEEKLKSTNFSQERSREHGCLDACTLRKLGIMESGKLSKDVIVTLLKENVNENERIAELSKVANVCMDEAGATDDECETAGIFSTCFREKVQETMKE